MAMERSVSRFSVVATALFMALLQACSRGDEPAYAKAPNGGGPRIAVIDIPAEPYKPVAVVNGVRLAGTVLFTGTRLADSAATPTRDQNVCGTSVTVPTL